MDTEQTTRRPGIDLKVSTLSEIYAYQPPEYIIEKLLAKGWLHLLGGPPGSAKTILSEAVCKSCVIGDSLFGEYEVNSIGPVLIIDEENPGGLLRDRLQKMGIDAGWPIYFLHFEEVRLDTEPCFHALMATIKQVEPVLVVLDSLIRFHRQDENDSKSMALVMANLRKISNLGVALLILHHHRKGNGKGRTGARGSSDIVAGVDVEYSLTKEGDYLTLGSQKTRIERFGPIKLKLEADKNEMAIRYLGHSKGKDSEGGDSVKGYYAREDDDVVARVIIAIVTKQKCDMSIDEIRRELKRQWLKVGKNRLRKLLKKLSDEGKIEEGTQGTGKTKKYVYRAVAA